MDWPTAAVAIAASAATSGVAIYALVQQGRNAEKDRAHDRDMRRSERRATAYVELLTALERQQMQVERTAPIFVEGQPPEPPPPLSDEELWRLSALAEVISSDALRARIEAWTQKQRQFFNDVLYLRQVQAHQQGRRPSETKDAFGVTSLEQWRKVETRRAELRDDLRAIGQQVRAEL